MNVSVVLTCFNRKELTLRCIKSLAEKNTKANMKFIIVDDNSNDGTGEALSALSYDITLIKGNGSLFWAGGMRKGINHFINNDINSDYVLFVNDDVDFFENVIDNLIEDSVNKGNAVIAGATCDKNKQFTYGAMKLYEPIKKHLYYHIKPEESDVPCNTFNCNCVLFPADIVKKEGTFDDHFVQSLADVDYGLKLSNAGYCIYSSSEYVGICEKNDSKGTWTDNSLSIRNRIKLKESPKGAPTKQWFYFMKKNFGLNRALEGVITPYIRIFLRK